MKTFWLLPAVVVGGSLLGGMRLSAAGIDPIMLPVHINASATPGEEAPEPYFSLSLGDSNGGDLGTDENGMELSLTDSGGKTIAAMAPNKLYYINVYAPDCATATFSVVAPPGYTATIDGSVIPTQGNFVDDGGGLFVVQIIPNDQAPAANSGVASSFLTDHPYWQVSMGRLRDGTSAGWISMSASYNNNNLSPLFTSAALQYIAASPEITVTPDSNGNIRQIIGNDALLDVVPGPSPNSSDSYYLNFYSISELDLSSGTPVTIPSGVLPFVSYLVSGAAGTSQITITSNTYDASHGLSNPARTASTTLSVSGSSTPYTWTTQDWSTSSSNYVSIVTGHAGSTNSSTPETTQISYNGGTEVFSVSKVFANETWSDTGGPSLVLKSTGLSNPVPEADQYYTGSSATSADLGFPMITSVNGSWVGYEYQADSNADANDGIVSAVHKQYLQSTTLAPTSLSGDTNGAVTYYTYGQEDAYQQFLPTAMQTVYNGATISSSTISYEGYDPEVKLNNVISVVANRTDSTGGSTLSSQTLYVREDWPDLFYTNKPLQVTRSDGTADLYAYQRGSYSYSTASAFPSSSSSFSTSGLGSSTATNTRILVIHGSTMSSFNGVSNTAITSTADGYSFVPVDTSDVATVYLVPNQSTAEVTVRDQYAHIVYTESDVWNGSSWQMFNPVTYTYDSNYHHLVSVTASGLTTTYTYIGEQLNTQTDPAGVVTTYCYDAMGRQSSVQVQAGSSSLATNSLTTASSYDAAGRVVQKVVGGGITSSTSYDDAGRVASVTDPNAGTTSYSYAYTSPTSPSMTNTVTATTATGATKIDVTYPDGHLVSESGSGVVARQVSYTQNSDGTLATTVVINSNSGTATQRQETVTTDLLGRTISEVKPTYNGAGTYTVTNVYNSSGQLSEVERTDGSSPLANEFYLYDAMGQRYRQGLDLDGGTGLATGSTSDRIADTIEDIESYSGSLWKTTTTMTYPTSGSSSPTTTSVVRDKLMASNSSTTLEAEEMVTDSYGTTTDTQTSVSLSTNAIVTATTNPGFSNTAQTISVAGLPISTTGFDGLTTTVGYDSLWRPTSQTDSRGNTSTIYYQSGNTLVDHTTDGAGATVASYTYDAGGKVISVADSLGNTTQTVYDLLNHVVFQGGTGKYPVQYVYNGYGEQVTMNTFQGGSGWSSSTGAPTGTATGTTNWSYDPPTGLLVSKEDAAGQSVSYTYDNFGRTLTRTWARGVVTTYSYNAATGELDGISYSDGTPSVGYTYNRAGQLSTVADATTAGDSGVRTFAYDGSVDANPLELEGEHLDGSFYGGRWLSRLYQNGSAVGSEDWGPYVPGFVYGRPIGFQLGTSENSATDVKENFTYSELGRFVGVSTQTASSGTTSDFIYTYASSSNLVSGYSDDQTSFSLAKTYESQRDVLASITANWGGGSTPLTSFVYAHNAAYQSQSVVQSGAAFSDYGGPNSGATFQTFAYDSMGQLTNAVGYLGGSTSNFASPLPDRNYAYSYDSEGNRATSNYTGISSLLETYTTNNLNQYTERDNLSVPVSGNVASGQVVLQTYSSATTSSTVANIQGGFWGGQLIPAADSSGNPVNNSGPVLLPLIVSALQTSGSSTLVNVQPSPQIYQAIAEKHQSFSFDLDGNMVADGNVGSGTEMWTYAYDGENRVKSMQEASLTNSPHCYTISFTYDYMGRRAEKIVTDSVNSANNSDHRYVYDGWNLVADYLYTSGGSPALTLKRTFTWGLDVAGTLSDTGGVGALVDITNVGSSSTTDYLPTYDGSGNITALVKGSSGALAAVYEYSPFGETLRTQPPLTDSGGNYSSATDTSIADNPFRFSTKFTDVESGLIYYGNRFYSPALGRFINRDPVEESGGVNLYGFVDNDPINGCDVLGCDAFSDYENGYWNTVRNAEQATQSLAEGQGDGFIYGGGLQQMVNEQNAAAALKAYLNNQVALGKMSAAERDDALSGFSTHLPAVRVVLGTPVVMDNEGSGISLSPSASPQNGDQQNSDSGNEDPGANLGSGDVPDAPNNTGNFTSQRASGNSGSAALVINPGADPAYRGGEYTFGLPTDTSGNMVNPDGTPINLAPFVVDGGSQSPTATQNALSLIGIGMTIQSTSLSWIGRFTGLSEPASKAIMKGVQRKFGWAGLLLSAEALRESHWRGRENWIGFIGGVAGVIPSPWTEGTATIIAVGTTYYDITHFQPTAPVSSG